MTEEEFLAARLGSSVAAALQTTTALGLVGRIDLMTLRARYLSPDQERDSPVIEIRCWIRMKPIEEVQQLNRLAEKLGTVARELNDLKLLLAPTPREEMRERWLRQQVSTLQAAIENYKFSYRAAQLIGHSVVPLDPLSAEDAGRRIANAFGVRLLRGETTEARSIFGDHPPSWEQIAATDHVSWDG